jgi:hypothetical protein
MALTEIRIARNDWVSDERRRRLPHEARNTFEVTLGHPRTAVRS